MLWLCDRFGWEVAHKAPLSEMRKMLTAENVYGAYRSRENYRDKDGKPNWVEWSNNNPTMSEILSLAMMIAETEDDGGNS